MKVLIACEISIHALCEEGDDGPDRLGVQGFLFLSTPSARRATARGVFGCLFATGFLSTPSARRATRTGTTASRSISISIHALCEEGDRTSSKTTFWRANFYPRPLRGGRHLAEQRGQAHFVFLSTPSARRATGVYHTETKRRKFLSTPSARRATYALRRRCAGSVISIHALCEEGDLCTAWDLLGPKLFLSTPSARRATAKTETKSLFSNKLYNILHEFRRALIYNGSKNDPNHAK